MKRKLFALIILCCAICFALIGLTACKEQHMHVYNQRIASETYLASDATCTQKEKYYFSCKCGDVGNVTFEKYVEHTYSNEYSFSGTYHWLDATCGCDTKKDYNKHIIKNDGHCSVCALPAFSINGIVYEKSSSDSCVDVIGYVGTAIKVEITCEDEIPNNISKIRIKKDAFKGNNTIKTLIVSEAVTEIEKGAFADMQSLQSLVLPFVGRYRNSDAYQNESAASVGKAVDAERTIAHLFGAEEYSCGVKVSVNYGAGATICYMPITLKKVTVSSIIPYSIPMFAFNGAKNISTIELAGNIDAIGVSAFENTAITNIFIPLSVENIYKNAFRGCSSLRMIFCEVSSQPNVWNSNWKSGCSAEVVWGYDGE